MPNIRKRGDKWQVQFRRRGVSPITRSFIHKKDAETWARQIGVQADRQDLPADPKQLIRLTLGDLVKRYLKSESPRKRGHDIEKMVLSAFLNHTICFKRLSDVTTADFVNYRDERLKVIKPRSLQRQLSPLHNMFEVARNEWGLALKENPLDKVKLDCPNNRRERRLREGELEGIIEAATKLRNPITLPVIHFALHTAMRRSEILSSTWGDLDMTKRVLNIPMSKNGYSRAMAYIRKTRVV
jgi:integrase